MTTGILGSSMQQALENKPIFVATSPRTAWTPNGPIGERSNSPLGRKKRLHSHGSFMMRRGVSIVAMARVPVPCTAQALMERVDSRVMTSRQGVTHQQSRNASMKLVSY